MNEHLFDDLYESLQVSSNADLETIERVYRLLAKRYHPDNNITGNHEKFEGVTRAYKTLSDPEKRAAYDVNYEKAKNREWKAVSKAFSSKGFETDRQIRSTILSILYIKRRESPSDAGVGTWQLENLIEWPEKTLEFHIWYLKEKNWIERTESGGFAITAGGVDEIEATGLITGKDRLLPEFTESSEEDKSVKLIEAFGLDTLDTRKSAIENPKRKLKSDSNDGGL